MHGLRKLTQNPVWASLLLTGLNILPVGIKFFLLPFYLMVLEPEEYGMLALVYIFSSLYEFSNLKIQTAVQTYFFDYNHEPRLLTKYISNILSFSILLSGLTTMILFGLGIWVFQWMFKTDDLTFYPYGAMAISASFLLVNLQIYFSYLKNAKKLTEFAAYSLSLVLLKVLGQIIFIFGFGMGIMGILLGDLIGVLIVAIYFLMKNYSYLTLNWEKKYIIPSLKYSTNLLPFFIVLWSAQKIDRFYIERLMDIAYVGKYAVLVAVTGFVMIVVNGTSTAFRPYLFERFKKGTEENKKEIQSLEKVFVSLVLLASSFIIMIGVNLDLIVFNEKYLSIMELVPLAVMVPLVFGWVVWLSQQLIFSKQASKISLASVLSLVLQLILYYLLIPIYGLVGVLWVNIIGNMMMCVCFYFYGKKYFPVEHDLFVLWIWPLIFIILVFGLQYLFNKWDFDLNVFGILQFLILSLLIGVFSSNEIRKIYYRKRKTV